ncbi:isochorismatase family protein [Novosphingobium resinovorum]|uniref:Isochorismatase n=1 Tax=Novosphingobium resinovorum TaxID=158500 RepID=A0A031JRV9_9SPHN|nr:MULTISPECIES: isochorismatase family protein [Novosphingobium]AOR79540.1 isochorismatase [Novosphingobium resinovorum]EZP80506.1 Isochorismatase hydrolase [Novosphingobium resinovorum]MBF7013528.1 isochorismatase family protein [Novosphingobium sp. HR1a]WJM25678.1 isochorismatase family protein [Novosphingobium resinovorum]
MSDLLDDYNRGGFGGALQPGKKPALLLVDVVVAYLTPGQPLYSPRFETALASCERLTEAARKAGVPVIFTNVVYRAGGKDGGLFYRKVPALEAFLEGSPLGAFPDTLQPRADEVVVTKQYASSFFGTSLAATLTSMGVDSLFITGFSTSGCVRASALDALQNGFVPLVVADACGDRDERPHEANLFDLSKKYAEVLSEEQAIALMG